MNVVLASVRGKFALAGRPSQQPRTAALPGLASTPPLSIRKILLASALTPGYLLSSHWDAEIFLTLTRMRLTGLHRSRP